MSVTHYFTFGQSHRDNNGSPLADYWVAVELPDNSTLYHCEVFIERFAQIHLPSPTQWAFEYTESQFRPEYFKGGEIERIKL